MKRLREILMAAFASGAMAGLMLAAARSLLLGEEMACRADGVCAGAIVLLPFFVFLFCIPVTGILQWFAWRMEDSWTPRAHAIRRCAALCPKILKAVYILGMAPALMFLFFGGEASMAGGIIMLYMMPPVGYLVMAVLVVLRDAAEAVHVPLALLPDGAANISGWLAFFAAGWWQWFIEMPTLWRRWQAGRY